MKRKDKQIIFAKSGEPDDIQRSLDEARPGDTVVIPALTVCLNGKTLFVRAGIKVRGMGIDF